MIHFWIFYSRSNHCFFNFSTFSNADKSPVSWAIVGGEEKEGAWFPAVLILEAEEVSVLILEAVRPSAVLVLISKGTRPLVMLSVPPVKSTSNRHWTRLKILLNMNYQLLERLVTLLLEVKQKIK